MERVYVIMGDQYDGGEYLDTFPVDVVSSISRAEELCALYESENPDIVYYYYAIIPSEE